MTQKVWLWLSSSISQGKIAWLLQNQAGLSSPLSYALVRHGTRWVASTIVDRQLWGARQVMGTEFGFSAKTAMFFTVGLSLLTPPPQLIVFKPDECTKALQTEFLYLAKMSWFLLFFGCLFFFFLFWLAWPQHQLCQNPRNVGSAFHCDHSFLCTLWHITCAQLPNSTSILQ